MPKEKTFDLFQNSTSTWVLPAVSVDLSSLDWSYVAEGNRNIVFGNETIGCVLRILKDRPSSVKSDGPSPYENEVEEQWEYLCNVIKPLLRTSYYMLDGKIVHMSDDLIAKVTEKVHKGRPKCRISRGISKTVLKAFLYPHLGISPTCLPQARTLCVEIKPKWGFLPIVRSIRSDTNIKQKVCRFCMNQKLKLFRGQISHLSQYCPLDLFSGCTCRMKHALSSLIETPQVNMRLLLDGKPIYGDINDKSTDKNNLESKLASFFGVCRKGCSNIDHLCELTASVFLKDSYGNTNTFPNRGSQTCSSFKPMCPKTVQWRDNLPKGDIHCEPFDDKGVFSILQPLQRMGGIDVEDIYPIYKKFAENKEKIEQWKLFDSSIWHDVVNELTDKLSDGKDLFKGPSPGNEIASVCKFLIASTFRDCSVMVSLTQSLSPRSTRNSLYDCCSGKNFSYKIHITDLDPKSVQKIPQYLKLDRDVVSHYLNSS